MRYELVLHGGAQRVLRRFRSDDEYRVGDRITVAGEVWQITEAIDAAEPEGDASLRRIVCVPESEEDRGRIL